MDKTRQPPKEAPKERAKDAGNLKGRPETGPGVDEGRASRPPADANEAIVDRQTVQPEWQPFDPDVNQRPR